MIASVESLDLDVFRRYAGLSLPRHVAYPMPTWWREMGGDEVAELYAAADGHHPTQDLSLYLHVPFCETLCKFCACNRVILRHDAAGAAERVDRYVAALQQDIRRLANGTGNGPALRQVHYGGGSPTYLSDEQIGRIQATIVEAFDLAPEAEVAMEIDPRGVTPERLRCLRDVGFNRLSMGVQDFDHQVQRHVRRVQPFDMVRDVVAAARDIGFASVNFDLIYGMPYQTLQTIADAVERTIELKPDRVAFYHYAQIPEKIATQRGMDYTRLPGSEAKLAMFLEGLTRFEAAGYRFIGLDHFARPDEALFTALDDGTVQRNFQGMTTGGGLRLLGAGVSAISLLPDVGYLQNDKDIDRYVQGIETGRSPVVRGLRLSLDDRIRQTVINELYCTARLVPDAVEHRFGIRFGEYFPRELTLLSELQRDGLVTVDDAGVIEITRPLGRVLMRNVAAVFDAYLAPDAYREGETACFSANA